MKEFIKQIPLTTLIIIYLFVCGGLYLLGFWSTFKIDVFSIIDIWDIPKNFIYPVMLTLCFSISILMLIFLIAKSIFKRFKNRPIGHKAHLKRADMPVIIFSILSTISAILIPIFRQAPQLWISMTYFLGAAIGFEIYFIDKFQELLPYVYIRLALCFVIFIIPFTCFGIGKKESCNIYYNIKVKYANINIANSKSITDSTRLKFIGFLGDKLIVSNLNNEKIFVLNQSAFDVIEIGDSTQINKK